VLLAAWLFHEHAGGRMLVAVLSTLAGSVLLALSVVATNPGAILGTLAVLAATLFWALDNVLTRGLSEQDPVAVVAAKGALGATATTLAAFVAHESLPSAAAIAVLLVCGATGYGLSLRLYLTAQRRLGAARTGSVFAIAPFVGAALSWLLGDASGGHSASLGAVIAVPLFAVGVWLHLTEHHHHAHSHVAVTHEHPHTHDDGHHDHTHDPPLPPGTEHSHVHHHDPVTHDHEHAPDIHHDHTHEDDHEHDHDHAS